MPTQPVVILGAGYTGHCVYALAVDKGRIVFATSRDPTQHLQFAQPQHRVEFDLMKPATWDHLPKDCDVIWCFPALPEEQALAFLESRSSSVGRLIILGSTSAYPSGTTTGVIDESTRVNLSLPRVKSEEQIRQKFGATILRLAGLYGPGRNVLDWIRRGKVGNIDRWVNLIHIQDVAGLCWAALDDAEPGESYIVSEGTPRRWSDICREAHARWHVPLPPPSQARDTGKRLSPHKLFSTLTYSLQFPDLYEALQHLESHSPTRR